MGSLTSPPTIIDLDSLNAYSSSTAYAVSGTIAVGSVTTEFGDHAVAWDLSNPSLPIIHDLGTLTGGTYSYAQAVSGTIVVGQANDASGNPHAFAYDLAAPQMIDLGTLGGLNSGAWAVSGNNIVGQADIAAANETHAALWLHAITINTSVTLVPATQAVCQGSTVDVSVDMSDSPGITMTAINAVILYDPTVFTYVDPSVVQGAFLTGDWDFLAAADTPGELRVGAMIWDPPFSEDCSGGGWNVVHLHSAGECRCAPGTFRAELGVATAAQVGVGFDYGDADWNDVVLPSSGASITISSTPSTLDTSVTLVPDGCTYVRVRR